MSMSYDERFRQVREWRRLMDLSKLQSHEIEGLETHLQRLRKRTFALFSTMQPSLSRSQMRARTSTSRARNTCARPAQHLTSLGARRRKTGESGRPQDGLLVARAVSVPAEHMIRAQSQLDRKVLQTAGAVLFWSVQLQFSVLISYILQDWSRK